MPIREAEGPPGDSSGCDVAIRGAEEPPGDRSRCSVWAHEVPRRALTLERLREVEQRPPLTEDQLLEIAGNLCCCLTEVPAWPSVES